MSGKLTVFIAVFIALVLFAYHKAHGFSGAAPKDTKIQGEIPWNLGHGYFDDVEKSNRCYWLRDGSQLAISCVPF